MKFMMSLVQIVSVVDCLKVPTAKPWNCVRALMLHPKPIPSRENLGTLSLKLHEAADVAGFVLSTGKNSTV
jgi:hypothetical protein